MGDKSLRILNVFSEYAVIMGSQEAIEKLREAGVSVKPWGSGGLFKVRVDDLKKAGLVSDAEISALKPKVEIRRPEKKPEPPMLQRGKAKPSVEFFLEEKKKAYMAALEFIVTPDLREMLKAEILDPNKHFSAQLLVRMPRTLKDKLQAVVRMLNVRFGTNYTLNSLVVTMLTIFADTVYQMLTEEFEKQRSQQ